MTNANRTRLVNAHQMFLEEMLVEAQQSLAFARSVKEARFLQNKISYLKQRLNGIVSMDGDGNGTRSVSKRGRRS